MVTGQSIFFPQVLQELFFFKFIVENSFDNTSNKTSFPDVFFIESNVFIVSPACNTPIVPTAGLNTPKAPQESSVKL